MSPRPALRDRWMWDWELLRWSVAAPVVVAIILAAALYPSFGAKSLNFLLIGLVGVFNGVIYTAVGSKVRSLKQTVAADGGEVVESLIVIGKIQSPGVAILKETELVLIPIVGQPRTLRLDELEDLRNESFFNGKTLVWKRWLVLSAKPRLGFAVPKAIASRWCARLAG